MKIINILLDGPESQDDSTISTIVNLIQAQFSVVVKSDNLIQISPNTMSALPDHSPAVQADTIEPTLNVQIAPEEPTVELPVSVSIDGEDCNSFENLPPELTADTAAIEPGPAVYEPKYVNVYFNSCGLSVEAECKDLNDDIDAEMYCDFKINERDPVRALDTAQVFYGEYSFEVTIIRDTVCALYTTIGSICRPMRVKLVSLPRDISANPSVLINNQYLSNIKSDDQISTQQHPF